MTTDLVGGWEEAIGQGGLTACLTGTVRQAERELGHHRTEARQRPSVARPVLTLLSQGWRQLVLLQPLLTPGLVPALMSTVQMCYVHCSNVLCPLFKCAMSTVQMCYIRCSNVLCPLSKCALSTVQMCYIRCSNVLYPLFKCAISTVQMCYIHCSNVL